MGNGIFWILALLFFFLGYQSQSLKSRKAKDILPEESGTEFAGKEIKRKLPGRKIKKLSPEEVKREVNADEKN